MTESVNPRLIKTNIDQLTRLVKRPMVTEKILARPPFRFLHDLTTLIVKNTGYLRGLFTETEFVFDNVNNKDSKITFLDKLIDAIGFINGKAIDVKSAKIVAGLEVEKTNRLLNEFAKCVQDKKPFLEAVDKVRKGQKPPVKAGTSSKSGPAAAAPSTVAKKTPGGLSGGKPAAAAAGSTKRGTVPGVPGSKQTGPKTKQATIAKPVKPVDPDPEPEPNEPEDPEPNRIQNDTIVEEEDDEEEEEEEKSPPIAIEENKIPESSKEKDDNVENIEKFQEVPKSPLTNIGRIQDNDDDPMDKLLNDNINDIDEEEEEEEAPKPLKSIDSSMLDIGSKITSTNGSNLNDNDSSSKRIPDEDKVPNDIQDLQERKLSALDKSLPGPDEKEDNSEVTSDPVDTLDKAASVKTKTSPNGTKSSRTRQRNQVVAPKPPSALLQVQQQSSSSTTTTINNRRNSSSSAAPITLKSSTRSLDPKPEIGPDGTNPSVQGRKNPNPTAQHRSARPSSSRPAPPRVMTASQRATLGRVVESRLEMLPSGGDNNNNNNDYSPQQQRQLNWLNTMNDGNGLEDVNNNNNEDTGDEYVISSKKLQESLLKMNSGQTDDFGNNEKNSFYADTETKGFLVQQLMDTKSELEGRNGQFDGTSLQSSIDSSSPSSVNTVKIRSNVQGLCQSIGTLSKALDYLHEDIDPMMDELKRWHQEYRANLTTIARIKKESKKEIEPLQLELDQLENESKEFRQKLSAIKANVYRNNFTIGKLIESV